MLPSLVMGASAFAIYRLVRPKTLIAEYQLRLMQAQTQSAPISLHIRIHTICLVLAALLQTITIAVCGLPLLTKETVMSSLVILSGYQMFSIVLVLPLFLALFRLYKIPLFTRFSSGLVTADALIQVNVFLLLAGMLLPVFEYCILQLGLAPVAAWLVKDVFRINMALSTMPLAILSMCMVTKNADNIIPKGMKVEELRHYRILIEDTKRDDSQLKWRPDEELSRMIDVAHCSGDLITADGLSKVLLLRHTHRN